MNKETRTVKKYSLTIHDMTHSDVADVLCLLNPTDVAEKFETPVVTNVTNIVATPPTPSEVTMAAAVEANILPEHFTEPEANFTPSPTEDITGVQGEELDATGIPWDERIHTSTKTQTQKGFWKRKPRVEDDVFDTIVTELQTSTPVEAEVVVVPPAANIPPPPAAAAEPVPAARDYTGLMTKIQQDFTNGIVDATYANTIVDRINTGFKTNVPTIVDIGSNAEMVAYAWQCVDVDTAARAA